MSSLSNFLKKNILSLDAAITAKVSGILSSINGSISITDTTFNKLFGGLLSGNSAITTTALSYAEESIVSKDQTITSTAVDAQKVPITSNASSQTFAQSAANPSITSISYTQPNDLSVTPVGIEPPMAFRGQYPYVHSYKSESVKNTFKDFVNIVFNKYPKAPALGIRPIMMDECVRKSYKTTYNSYKLENKSNILSVNFS